MGTSGSSPERAVGVLFLHSATLPPLGADVWVHAQIMRSLDRSSHVVHAACATGRPGRPTPTYDLLRRIPGVQLKAVDLGPELSMQPSKWAKLKALVATLPAILSCLRLAVYIRRNGIELIHTSDRPRDAFAAVLSGPRHRREERRPRPRRLRRVDEPAAQVVAGSSRRTHRGVPLRGALTGRERPPTEHARMWC